MLTAVFAECARKLEPGGRIAVNVANPRRKPYRSLSADVVRILDTTSASCFAASSSGEG
jgi:site-specific DNA-methyltransferase (adenine-specific)